jgi:hypothetical protein
MKTILAALLLIVLSLTLFACSQPKNNENLRATIAKQEPGSSIDIVASSPEEAIDIFIKAAYSKEASIEKVLGFASQSALGEGEDSVVVSVICFDGSFTGLGPNTSDALVSIIKDKGDDQWTLKRWPYQSDEISPEEKALPPIISNTTNQKQFNMIAKSLTKTLPKKCQT